MHLLVLFLIVVTHLFENVCSKLVTMELKLPHELF